MSVLLVAATEAEVRETKDRFRWDPRVDLLVTGMGILPTAFALTRQLLKSGGYDLVVQGGVAGAINPELRMGEVVQVVRETLIDFGAEDTDGRTLTVPELGFSYPTGFNDNGILALDSGATRLPYRKVVGGTVQRGSGMDASIARIHRQYPDVEVESMEGAALAYVCGGLDQPAVQLRAISNYVTARDRDKWDLPLAIDCLNRALVDLLVQL